MQITHMLRFLELRYHLLRKCCLCPTVNSSGNYLSWLMSAFSHLSASPILDLITQFFLTGNHNLISKVTSNTIKSTSLAEYPLSQPHGCKNVHVYLLHMPLSDPTLYSPVPLPNQLPMFPSPSSANSLYIAFTPSLYPLHTLSSKISFIQSNIPVLQFFSPLRPPVSWSLSHFLSLF